MMDIAGTYVFDHPQPTVWDALTDPDRITTAMPGVRQLIPIDGQPLAWQAIISLSFIGISAEFGGEISLSDLAAPDQFRLNISGGSQDSRIEGSALLSLSPVPEAETPQTELRYAGTASATGKFESFPPSMVKTLVMTLARMFFGGLARTLPSPEEPTDA
ncbi:MAG: SRPBCC domain-containing protein [Anaerolineae bacterium]|jgi:carbon monoxide dehydrogenase subunit G|nr:SRPBCC domain-containing protein [Anaerolineae bacterium]